MKGFFNKSNQGGALLQVIIATAITTTLIAAITTFESMRRSQLKIFEFEKKRNEIIKHLENNLVNRKNLLASSKLKYLSNNDMLENCLSDYDTTCSANNWYDFVLVADESVLLEDPSLYSNCRNNVTRRGSVDYPNDAECYLGGRYQGGLYVSYNFKGERGSSFSQKEYPLQVNVMFSPVCPNNQSSCNIASSILLKYTLTHFPGPEFYNNKRVNINKVFKVYPTNEDYYLEVAQSRIVGQMCNEGAKLMKINDKGQTTCQCILPYKNKINPSTGQPLSNEFGQLCDKTLSSCQQSGGIINGQNQFGDVECIYPNAKIETFTPYINTSTSTSAGKSSINSLLTRVLGVTTNKIDCTKSKDWTWVNGSWTIDRPGGWISSIVNRCSSSIKFVKKTNENPLISEQLFMGVMLGGFGAYLLLAVAIAFYTGPIGLAVLVGLSILVTAAVIATAVLYFMGVGDKDWWLKATADPTYNDKCLILKEKEWPSGGRNLWCPKIRCFWQAECSWYKIY